MITFLTLFCLILFAVPVALIPFADSEPEDAGPTTASSPRTDEATARSYVTVPPGFFF